jgi:hypothetical protein
MANPAPNDRRIDYIELPATDISAIEMAAVMRISEREDRKLRSLLQKLTVSVTARSDDA